MGFQCPLCADFSAPSLKFLIVHIGRVHANDPNFRISCGVGGCQATYRNFRCFKDHLKRRHPHQLEQPQVQASSSRSSYSLDPDPMETDGHDFDHQFDLGSSTAHEMKRQTALWILKLKEKSNLTQCALDQILSDVTDLLKDLIIKMGRQICKELQKADVDPQVVSVISNFFSEDSEYCNPFTGMDTSYKQLNFYKNELNLVEPDRIYLGSYYHTSRVHGGSQLAKVDDHFIYVPILKTLERMLQNARILSEVSGGHTRSDGILCDICDADRFKAHPLYSNDPTALQIILYFDELEVCNPIGSNRKKHKLGCFYFSLGNIHPKYRSKLNSIQLLGLIKVGLIGQYGIDSVLEKIVQDVKKLEKGHTFETAEGAKLMKGTIITCIGDNLGSHAMGGFKEGGRAECPCRHCMISYNEMCTKFHESEVTLRDEIKHAHHCQLLASSTGRLQDSYSTAFGVNRNSVLNSLDFANVAVELLPPDIMHDLLEGYLPYVCKQLLIALRGSGVTLDNLNRSIRAFDFGMDDKPSEVPESVLESSSGTHFGQSASKMWSLARLLPMILGPNIEEDNQYWLHYLQLLNIVELTFSPVVYPSIPSFLQIQIQDNLQTFTELYPHCSFIPKMHYLIHIPRFLKRHSSIAFINLATIIAYWCGKFHETPLPWVGPLVHHWTMRFEAKHRYFKRLATTMGNYINIPYSLALRHQCLQTYISAGDSKLDDITMDTGKGSVIHATESAEYGDLLIEKELHTVYRVASGIFEGTRYKKGYVVVTGTHELTRYPVFQIIEEIFLKDSAIWLGLVEQDTVDFLTHYNAWRIKPKITKVLFNLDNLYSRQCLLPRPLPNTPQIYSFITLHHAIN